MTKLDVQLQEQIAAEVEAGYVRQTDHSEAPYRLFTYTQKGVIAGDWTQARKMCRGLIVDDSWEIIARPFPKFFNWGELSEKDQKRLRGVPFDVYEKLDGSLGIVYPMPDGTLRVATRGSFDSEQAQWATEWLQVYNPELETTYLTPCVEIIYPANRIVVDYGGRAELVFLAGVSKMTGYAHPEPYAVGWVGGPNTVAQHYGTLRDNNPAQIDALPDDGTFEGYVLHFHDPARTLVKVKLDEYVRLHRIVTNTTARTVWDVLRNGKSIQGLVDNVPEEFEWWVRETAEALTKVHSEMLYEVEQEFNRIESELWERDHESGYERAKGLSGYGYDRKEFAEEAKKWAHPGLLFATLDGRDISDKVWAMIRPEHETPFKVEER